MPGLTRGPAERELKRLIEIFLKAETDIINEILRLRSKGNADYHAAAALERVQGILRDLENDCWTYTPRMLEMQFYVNHPKARKPLDVPESPMKHLRGYQNAFGLTGEQTDIVRRLTDNLMGQITEASQTAVFGLESMLIGRTEPDIFRAVGLGQTALMQAKGSGVKESLSDFVETLRRDGVTAFVDKAGRRWNLHTYGSMVLRTTSRQAEVLSVLTQNEEHDLYQISSHGSTCPLCAVYEGRVYSRSGKDPNFPPLASAFGKMDPSGPDTLENSWLNIHPNCLHQLIRWTPMGRSTEEIQKIKDFSSFEKNPPSRDPRTQKQVEAYRQKERDRAKWLRDYRQWEKYRDTLGDQVPKTFETFRKHKLAGTEKYQAWKSEMRKQTTLEKSSKYDILKDITIEPIPITDDAVKRVPLIHLDAWNTDQDKKLQEAHREILRAAKVYPAGREVGRVYKMDMSPLSKLIIGSSEGSNIDPPDYNFPYILIHNHPSGNIFSLGDLHNFFYSRPNLQIMTAVGNNGKVFCLMKLDDYDGLHASRLWFQARTKLLEYANKKDLQGYIKETELFLNEVKNYGTLFITGRN